LFSKNEIYKITTIINEGLESVIEKLFRMTNFNTEEAYERFSNKIRRMGVDDELEKMGIKEGDTVRIFDFEFEWTR